MPLPTLILPALALATALCATALGDTLTPLATWPDVTGAALQQTMIWAPARAKLSSNYVAFRKPFRLDAAPPARAAAAVMHLFADARYVLWINGRYVTRGPARFDTKGPEYDTIEVAPFLRQGENVAVVLVLGNVSNGAMQRHAPALTARLDVPAADGTVRTVLQTDPTWTWSDRTRYRSPKMDWGNTLDRIDTRLDDGEWTQLEYDDARWQRAASVDGAQWGPLSARRIPLLRETPVAPTLARPLPVELGAGQKLTFKLDRLVQAYTSLEIDADADTQFTIDYAGIQYAARAGVQTYVSSDTHGVPGGGSITVKSGRATVRSLQLVERLYPFDILGSFTSEDPMLNKLWAMCARSGQVMSEDAYVDCSDRERVEWMDCDPPGFDITRTALAAAGPDGKPRYGDARLLHELLRRTALSLQPEGWVKAHTCSDRFDIHAKMEDRACEWVKGARRYYESTGDDAAIREIWPVIVAQMNWFLAQRTERGLVRAREWIVWGNPVGYQTLEGTGLNAFVYKALVDAAYLGRALGEDARPFEAAAADLAAAVNRELWDESAGTYFSGYFKRGTAPQLSQFVKQFDLAVNDGKVQPTMHAALWALDAGIVPADRRERVTRFLLANRTERARVMVNYYLFSQLYAQHTAALDEEVLEMIRTRWKAMAHWPWQTSWEELDGHGSRAHIYGMFPGYFLSAYVLGVRRDAPVWDRQLIVEPRLGELRRAAGTVVTEFGPVPVSWERQGKTLSFTVEVPRDVVATLRLAGGDARTLLINGKPIGTETVGRYVVAKLRSGQHCGTVGLTTR